MAFEEQQISVLNFSYSLTVCFVAGAMDTENSGRQSERLSSTAQEAVSFCEEHDGKCSRRYLVR